MKVLEMKSSSLKETMDTFLIIMALISLIWFSACYCKIMVIFYKILSLFICIIIITLFTKISLKLHLFQHIAKDIQICLYIHQTFYYLITYIYIYNDKSILIIQYV
jgi:hypothetical protein